MQRKIIPMNAKTSSPQDTQPLTPIVFHMLLALADGEKHGYAIMKTVEEDTNGQMQIRIGSLYGSIQRMVEAGLIEESEERPDPELDDKRRRYYRLTSYGMSMLQAEARRLSDLASVIQSKRILDQLT
jgi:DNA-binding PadR family transcriptional regulator